MSRVKPRLRDSVAETAARAVRDDSPSPCLIVGTALQDNAEGALIVPAMLSWDGGLATGDGQRAWCGKVQSQGRMLMA